MKRALKELSDMSTNLEATGIERPQAAATLEAIANSIEKFAVTPELLRKTLEESQEAWYQRIKKEMDLRFGSVNHQFKVADRSVDQRFDSVNRQFESAKENVDQRFDAVDRQFESAKGNVDQRFDAVDQRLDDIFTNVNDLRQQQRADSTKLFNLMLAIALGMAGVTGGLIFGQFF